MKEMQEVKQTELFVSNIWLQTTDDGMIQGAYTKEFTQPGRQRTYNISSSNLLVMCFLKPVKSCKCRTQA